jgi:hypothetical protein
MYAAVPPLASANTASNPITAVGGLLSVDVGAGRVAAPVSVPSLRRGVGLLVDTAAARGVLLSFGVALAVAGQVDLAGAGVACGGEEPPPQLGTVKNAVPSRTDWPRHR